MVGLNIKQKVPWHNLNDTDLRLLANKDITNAQTISGENALDKFSMECSAKRCRYNGHTY